MDIDRAFHILWQETLRSSQARVADEIGVSPSVLSSWKKGSKPEGENREKLFVWAEQRPARRVAEPSTAPYNSGLEASMPASLVAFYSGVAVGMASSVRNILASAVQEQDSLIAHLNSMARDENFTLPARANSSTVDFVTPAELDEDDREINDMQDVATGKKKRKTG